MYPDTRGRISTDSTGSSRPVNSSHSFTSFSTTVTTLTGKAGCCVTDAFLQPLPVKKTSRKTAHAKKNCFIKSGSHSFELIANRGFGGEEAAIGVSCSPALANSACQVAQRLNIASVIICSNVSSKKKVQLR